MIFLRIPEIQEFEDTQLYLGDLGTPGGFGDTH